MRNIIAHGPYSPVEPGLLVIGTHCDLDPDDHTRPRVEYAVFSMIGIASDGLSPRVQGGDAFLLDFHTILEGDELMEWFQEEVKQYAGDTCRIVLANGDTGDMLQDIDATTITEVMAAD